MNLNEISSSGMAVVSLLKKYSSRADELSQWLGEKTLSNQKFELSKSINYQHSIATQIPMPSSVEFSSLAELSQLMKRDFTFVVKFDTLICLGTQTIVVNSSTDFNDVIKFSQQTNARQGIVQQFVAGKEYTVVVLVGKNNWVKLGTAVDYKKQLDGNQGLNTFGMGSTSPCTYVASETDQIIDQVVQVLQQQGFVGPLSCQFILEPSGKLWLLEWNTRFCDPETQSIVECLDHTTARAIEQLVDGQHIDQPAIHNQNAVTVVLAHQDWPKPQPSRADLVLDPNPFKVYQCFGRWSQNLYWGSITNSGTADHAKLAGEIYDFLATQNTAPYRYRLDIAANQPQIS